MQMKKQRGRERVQGPQQTALKENSLGKEARTLKQAQSIMGTCYWVRDLCEDNQKIYIQLIQPTMTTYFVNIIGLRFILTLIET
jgi:hypothetical protein